MENDNKMIISKEKYINLLYFEMQLKHLENCGVRNWSKYSEPIPQNEIKDLIKNLEEKYKNFKPKHFQSFFDFLWDFIYTPKDNKKKMLGIWTLK